MILFFDEDRGKGVATALKAVGVDAIHVGKKRPVEPGTADVIWILRAGEHGWLVVTGNKAILTTAHERELWIQNRVGGVILSNNRITSIDELRFTLRKLTWREEIDQLRRPFAFMLSTDGRTARAPEIPIVLPGGQSAFDTIPT